ncbi:hypothetical protein, partial [Mesotoga prima]|uniref:hypothetical protein n=1 Tax=Mesotoga prima TaxID=1184387 RepID=UPI002C82EF18
LLAQAIQKARIIAASEGLAFASTTSRRKSISKCKTHGRRRVPFSKAVSKSTHPTASGPPARAGI